MSTPSSSSPSPSRKRLASEPEFWFSQLPPHLSFIFVPTLPADGPCLFLSSLPGLEINENSIPLPHSSKAKRNRIATVTLDAIEQDFVASSSHSAATFAIPARPRLKLPMLQHQKLSFGSIFMPFSTHSHPIRPT